jgi:general secretion pathway protein G
MNITKYNPNQIAHGRLSERGFTLLEMVMVMTIIVVLAVIGVASYQHLATKSRETVLKQDLKTMRKLIDDYATDREHLPQSIKDLVELGYMREVPVDPFTGEADWDETQGEDTVSKDGGQGMVDIHSKAQGTGTDGTAYRDY